MSLKEEAETYTRGLEQLCMGALEIQQYLTCFRRIAAEIGVPPNPKGAQYSHRFFFCAVSDAMIIACTFDICTLLLNEGEMSLHHFYGLAKAAKQPVVSSEILEEVAKKLNMARPVAARIGKLRNSHLAATGRNHHYDDILKRASRSLKDYEKALSFIFDILQALSSFLPAPLFDRADLENDVDDATTAIFEALSRDREQRAKESGGKRRVSPPY